jgi:hypothetical protein
VLDVTYRRLHGMLAGAQPGYPAWVVPGDTGKLGPTTVSGTGTHTPAGATRRIPDAHRPLLCFQGWACGVPGVTSMIEDRVWDINALGTVT